VGDDSRRDENVRRKQELLGRPDDAHYPERDLRPMWRATAQLIWCVCTDLHCIPDADVSYGRHLLVDNGLVVCLGVEHPARQHDGLVDLGKPTVPVRGEQHAVRLPVEVAKDQVPNR